MGDGKLSKRSNFLCVLGVLVRDVGKFTYGLVESLRKIAFPSKRPTSRVESETLLCIAAGVRGWESIEFQEISASAREFLGERQVLDLIITAPKTYLRQVSRALSRSGVTHYFFDPRTGSQNVLMASIQTLVIGVMLAWRGVTPIGYCTDISIRRWRLQVAFVTATKGVCVCFMNASNLGKIFPHPRIIGPSIMPFSLKTYEQISDLRSVSHSQSKKQVSFVGSLYEPRTSTLLKIKDLLERDSISFDISTRSMGEPRGPIREYWENLSRSEIQVTTTSQCRQRGTDFVEINQLVYRVTEALVCGAAMVVEEVDGASNFFEDGVHLCSFRTPSEAASVVKGLVEDPIRLAAIQEAGNRKIAEIIRDQVFWRSVDKGLGHSSLRLGGPE